MSFARMSSIGWLLFMLSLSVVASADNPDAAVRGPSGCPDFEDPVSRGKIASKKIDEASGIAASRRNPGVYYVHNDSGGKARIFAIDETGRDLARYNLDGVDAIDWEDIAVGPAPGESGSFIYAGDIGDNDHERASISVVRVPEPLVDRGIEAGKQHLAGAVILSVRYPHGNAYNSEVLIIDPETSDLYILTKVGRGESKLFRYAAPHDPGKVTELEEVASFSVGNHPVARSNKATGGDMSLEGNLIALRTYSQLLVWVRGAGETVAQAMSAPPCFTGNHMEPQGESIAWTLDSSALVTVSEGSKQPVYFSKVRP